MLKSLQHAEVNKATADFLTCSFFCVCMSLLTSACNNDVCWTAVEMLAVHFYAQWLETYPSTVVQDVCVRRWWEGVEYVNALYAVLLSVVATNPPPHTPSHVEKSSMTLWLLVCGSLTFVCVSRNFSFCSFDCPGCMMLQLRRSKCSFQIKYFPTIRYKTFGKSTRKCSSNTDLKDIHKNMKRFPFPHTHIIQEPMKTHKVPIAFPINPKFIVRN